MKKKSMFRKTAIALGTGVAVVMAVLAALLCVDVIDTLAQDELKEASFCSFVIPPEFVPGDEKGQFINKNYPMESSSINYSYYDNGLDNLPTNRERETMPEDAVVKVTDETQNLTKEIYQETMSAAYNSAYGEDVGYSVSSFKKINVDGYPGYKIEASFSAANDEEAVHQTVFMLLSRYRTFTITYQRADDDDCEEFFDESSGTIHVH